MPMKNSNDNIGNRTGDLPVCSAVKIRNEKRENKRMKRKKTTGLNTCKKAME
jgi:hypothetical protein